ncbi:MAG: PIN domain-containing protein [Luteolibacter sp.]
MSTRVHYVLIDFENVQPESLEALGKDYFKVLMFVGASQTKLPFETVSSIQQMGTHAEYIKISGNGPNALDFHIAFYIGHLAAKEPNAEFLIISKDTGFDPLIQHLKSKKINVSRSKLVPGITAVKAVDAKTPKDRFEVLITKLQKLQSSKPRTVKTLSSTISTLFLKRISDEEVATLVQMLESRKIISVVANKVSYNPL